MRSRRVLIPQRAPVFIGGEGQSEIGYAGWLRILVRDRGLPFHLQLDDLGLGAGDPLTRIDLAADRVARFERNREPFVARFLFLDTDQLADDAGRAQQARQRALDHGFTVIWQAPTHEAFLLRHFAGREMHQPPDSRASEIALGKEWPQYRKPCTARQLENSIALEGARRVAARLPELAELLRLIGLLEN